MAKILITGASGLVGAELSTLLQDKHQVVHLGRTCSAKNKVTCYTWNYKQGKLATEALNGIEAVVHLAGAGVMDKKWSAAYQLEIIESRVKTLEMLYAGFEKLNHFPAVLVSASGVGYYGLQTELNEITEEHKPGDDFLAGVCVAWENAARKFEEKGCRVVLVRTGLVLSDKGGALPPLLKLNRFHLSSSTGNGKQFFAWIHSSDLCDFYRFAIEYKNISGAYNLVAPQHITAKQFDGALQLASGKKAYLPGAPAFVLKLLLGKRATALLSGLPICAKHTQSTGFSFRYTDIHVALKNLIKR